MNILQISTPFLPVSHNLTYGGIERIVSFLDDELTTRGHDSSVAAPTESQLSGVLLPTLKECIGVCGVLDKGGGNEFLGLNLRLEHVARSLQYAKANNYDFVHVHDDNFFPFMPMVSCPTLLTLHSDYGGGFWNLDHHPLLKNAPTNLVAISEHQKGTYEKAGFTVGHVVYNGIDTSLYAIAEEKIGNYLLSLGGVMPQKGQHLAIEVGKKTGLDVLIAGNIGNENYFQSSIQPHITKDLSKSINPFEDYINGPINCGHVVYTGPVGDIQKKFLYQHAKAFLMPITWDEPFGLVMIEAMASGTGVIAFSRGSVPEIVNDGKTGYVVETLDEMSSAVNKIGIINPRDCRIHVQHKFSKEKMTSDYLDLYRSL